MSRKLAILSFVLLFSAAAATTAQPRPDKSWKNWFGHMAAGYSSTQGDVGDLLDDGYNLRFGATYQPEEWPIGLVLETEFNDFDISNSAIREINDAIEDAGEEGEIRSGDLSSWSLTVNGTWSPRSGAGFYLIGGVGVYRLEGRLKEDGLVYYPPICDPWFWWCTPGGVGPGSVVRASESSTEFGWNAGIGWAWRVGLDSQVFLEARYHSAQTDRSSTDFLPISFGFRW